MENYKIVMEKAKKAARESNVIFNEEPITLEWLTKTGWIEDTYQDMGRYFCRSDIPGYIEGYFDLDENLFEIYSLDNGSRTILETKIKGPVIAFLYALTGKLEEV